MADMQNELDYTPDLITLEDEDGNEIQFEVIDVAEYNNTRYMAMVELQNENAAEEAVMLFMRVGEDAEGEYYDIVDDDEELYNVSKVFEARLKAFMELEGE